jgi:hypothetical protein
LIGVPWYVVAEMRTPGFLNYFLVGENLKRFLVPGWKGDLYGFTHGAPRGVVWMYFAAATLPWSLLAIPAALAFLLRRRWTEPSPDTSFLALACFAPLVFFTASAHVLWTYALPSIPSFAIWMAQWLERPDVQAGSLRFARAAVTAGMVIVGMGIVAASPALDENYSTWTLYRDWEAAQAIVPGPLVFEQRRVMPSLLFYSHGFARSHADEEDESTPHYDIYSRSQAEAFASQPRECAKARTLIAESHRYVLVYESNLPVYCDRF